jgi:8-oxo-dGTP diphosphatase
MKNGEIPNRVSLIDWSAWQPTERAVLSFIRDNDKILLIHKKTGLGAGKVNAPGGRIDPGETAMHAAVRETEEEVHLTPGNPEKRGELFFQFKDGYKLHGEVFFSTRYTGTPVETGEADPFWCRIDEIPYGDMWEDDRHWLPLALKGIPFKAYFIFDNDRMVDWKIDVERPICGAWL